MIAKRKNANNIREIIESVEYTKRVGSAWAIGAGNDNGSVQKAHGKRKKIMSNAKKGGSPPRPPQRGQQNHDLKIGGKVKIIVHNEETSTTTFCKDTRRRRDQRNKFRNSAPVDGLRVFSASSAQHVEPPRSATLLLLLSMSSAVKLDPSRGLATH